MLSDVANEETTNSSFVPNSPIPNIAEIDALIRCPVTGQIFFKPTKLLLVNKLDGGAIVEENIVKKLTACPFTRQEISGSVRVREIEHLVDWYLKIHPEEKNDQYPKTIEDIEAQEVLPQITRLAMQHYPQSSFAEICTQYLQRITYYYSLSINYSLPAFILSAAPSILATELGAFITKCNLEQNKQIIHANITGAITLLLLASLALGISEKTRYTTFNPFTQSLVFFRLMIERAINNAPTYLIIFMAYTIAASALGVLLTNTSNDDMSLSQIATTTAIGAGGLATIIGTTNAAVRFFSASPLEETSVALAAEIGHQHQA